MPKMYEMVYPGTAPEMIWRSEEATGHGKSDSLIVSREELTVRLYIEQL